MKRGKFQYTEAAQRQCNADADSAEVAQRQCDADADSAEVARRRRGQRISDTVVGVNGAGTERRGNHDLISCRRA